MNKTMKCIAVGMLGFHLISVGGCANKIEEVSSPNVIDKTDDNTIIQSSEKLENTTPESKQNENTDYIGNDLWIENLTDFSEGRAWVQFMESHRKD